MRPHTLRKEPVAKQNSNDGPTREQAFEQLIATLSALEEERGDDPIWASMIKQALKRRNPGFNERALGFPSFQEMLNAAEKQKLIQLETIGNSPNRSVKSVKS